MYRYLSLNQPQSIIPIDLIGMEWGHVWVVFKRSTRKLRIMNSNPVQGFQVRLGSPYVLISVKFLLSNYCNKIESYFKVKSMRWYVCNSIQKCRKFEKKKYCETCIRNGNRKKVSKMHSCYFLSHDYEKRTLFWDGAFGTGWSSLLLPLMQ